MNTDAALTVGEIKNLALGLAPDLEVWIYDERRDVESEALYAEVRELPDTEKKVLMIGVGIK